MADINVTLSSPLDLSLEILEYIGDSIDILIEPVGPLDLVCETIAIASINLGGGINFNTPHISLSVSLIQPTKIIHLGNLTNVVVSVTIGTSTTLDTGLTTNEQVVTTNSNRLMDLLLELKSVQRDPTNLSSGKTKVWNDTILSNLKEDYLLGRRLIMYDVYMYNKTDTQKTVR